MVGFQPLNHNKQKCKVAGGQNWYPTWNPAKWNQRLKPAVPWWLIFDPHPSVSQQPWEGMTKLDTPRKKHGLDVCHRAVAPSLPAYQSLQGFESWGQGSCESRGPAIPGPAILLKQLRRKNGHDLQHGCVHVLFTFKLFGGKASFQGPSQSDQSPKAYTPTCLSCQVQGPRFANSHHAPPEAACAACTDGEAASARCCEARRIVYAGARMGQVWCKLYVFVLCCVGRGGTACPETSRGIN